MNCLTCGTPATGADRCPVCGSLVMPAESERLGLPTGSSAWILRPTSARARWPLPALVGVMILGAAISIFVSWWAGLAVYAAGYLVIARADA